MAELADALDLGSSARRAWEFKSPSSYKTKYCSLLFELGKLYPNHSRFFNNSRHRIGAAPRDRPVQIIALLFNQLRPSIDLKYISLWIAYVFVGNSS